MKVEFGKTKDFSTYYDPSQARDSKIKLGLWNSFQRGGESFIYFLFFSFLIHTTVWNEFQTKNCEFSIIIHSKTYVTYFFCMLAFCN